MSFPSGGNQGGGEPVNKLMQIRDDRETSDITLVVGKGRKEFCLHKPIICFQSSFVRTLVLAAERTGGHKLPLPMVTPEAFEVLTRWMYGGGLHLEPEYGANVIEVFIGCKYLHLDDVRRKVLDHVTRVMERHLSKPVPLEDKEEAKRIAAKAGDVIRFFVQFCNASWDIDLEKLVECAGFIIRAQCIDIDSLMDSITEAQEAWGSLFITAIIQAGKDSASACEACEACDFGREMGIQETIDRIVGTVKSQQF
ncbi:hypothetical protein TWF481_003185 [Arthrobotrys musiformis]|uniref:BTB domain-containing protein n=1 Tax=Arthrobotrys musiformis TaxID=47236 RepID=A0AAV9VSI3_9PEZI